MPTRSDRQWEEPTPDLGAWALSVSVRHVTMRAGGGQQRTLGRGLGRLTGTEQAALRGGILQPAGLPVPDSERGPSSGEREPRLGAEPLRDRMKSLVPVSVFWN